MPGGIFLQESEQRFAFVSKRRHCALFQRAEWLERQQRDITRPVSAPDAGDKTGHDLDADAQRETGLADAAGPDERQQPRSLQPTHDLADLRAAARQRERSSVEKYLRHWRGAVKERRVLGTSRTGCDD